MGELHQMAPPATCVDVLVAGHGAVAEGPEGAARGRRHRVAVDDMAGLAVAYRVGGHARVACQDGEPGRGGLRGL